MLEGVVSLPLVGPNPPGDPSVRKEGAGGHPLFVVGPENRLVEAVLAAVSGGEPGIYNPLVLHGPSGSGKSHLAWGLAQLWKTQLGRKVEYDTADDFARKLIDARHTHALEDFRARYRRANLFVLEHLERVSNQPTAQEELINTIDALLSSGGQVLITAASAPGEIPNLLAGLAGRLVAGLVVALALPGVEARAEILRALARGRHLDVSEAVVRVLAEGLRSSPAELQGVVARMESAVRIEGKALDVELARELVSQHRGQHPPDLRRIAGCTARYFSLRVAELRGPSRRQAVVKARGVAMYLARRLTYESLEQIGGYFGGRDHTTVLHAFRKMEGLLSTEPAIHEAVRKLEHELAQ